MYPQIILLVGLTYVVGDKLYTNERVLGENGEPIRCGTKFKRDIGVTYQVAYWDEEMSSSAREKTPQAKEEISEVPPLPLIPKKDPPKDEDKDIETGPSTKTDLPPVQIYEYCLDEDTLSVMYAKYKLEEAKKNKINQKQDSDTPSTVYDRQVSYLSKSLQEESKTRGYYDMQTDYFWQSVGIEEFIGSPRLRKAFYKFDVTAPLNKELIKPWQELIQELQSKMSKFSGSLHVYSGIYETYRFHGVSMFMSRPLRKVKVPFAWWIMLVDEKETKGVSVIMENYAYSHGEEVEKICTPIVCSDVGLDVPEYKRASIYCCPASTINNEYAFTSQSIKDKDLLHFSSKREAEE